MTRKEHNDLQKEMALKRKEEYNKNPHLCKFCNTPILMKNTDKYNDIFRKKFCSPACASKYGHKITDKSKFITKTTSRIERDFSDKELISFYYESKSVKDLENKIGYKNILSQKRVVNRFLELGLDISKLKKPNGGGINASNLTKKELFSRCSNWQNARSWIQKSARKIYENSEKPKQCVVCGYDKHYEVAHIKAVSDFQDEALISEINDEGNLIALCPNHHWEYDNNNFDISEYIA